MSGRFRFLLGFTLLFAAACEPGASGDLISGSPEPVFQSDSGTEDPAASSFPGSGGSSGENPPDRQDGQDPPYSFAVKGDWGAGSREQEAVTAQMCSRRSRKPFDDVVTTGDNFYKPDGVASEENYYRPERCLIGHPDHRWRASWGNHDVAGDSTRAVLGAEMYYTWSAGEAQFYMLDSNRPSAGQTSWLASELKSSKAPVKIAVFHHPPFTSGTHESNMDVRSAWVPLFERYGASLVLSGHNHLYEHSQVNAVHYVTTGGGGANLYRCERKEPWLRRCEARHHFLSVEVTRSTTEVTALDSAGATVDQFRLHHPAR